MDMDRRDMLTAVGLGAVGIATFGVAGASAQQPSPQAPSTPARSNRSARDSQATQSLGVWKYEEVALVLIDYQKEMFDNIRSETPQALVELNTRMLIRTAKALDIPIVISTVGVEMGVNGPTRPSIVAELPKGTKIIDRSSMNAWEDPAFHRAIEATGRRRVIFGGLYTEICLAFPVEEALKEGYEAMFVVDAVGGLSQLAHQVAISRMIRAGGVATTTLALQAELFRDWKSPVAGKIKEIDDWYLPELQKLIKS